MEAVTPDTREQLNEILDALRRDKEKGWRMLPDATYIREDDGSESSSQEALYRFFSTRKVSLYEPEPEKTEIPIEEETADSRPKGFRAWFRRLRGS